MSLNEGAVHVDEIGTPETVACNHKTRGYHISRPYGIVQYFSCLMPLKWHLETFKLDKINRQGGSKQEIDLHEKVKFAVRALRLRTKNHHLDALFTCSCLAKTYRLYA